VLHPVSVFKPTRKTFKRNRRLPRVRLVPNFHRRVRSEGLKIAENVCVEPANAVIKINAACTEQHCVREQQPIGSGEVGREVHVQQQRCRLQNYALKQRHAGVADIV
jgi:hypothetical protein